ncbi:hypothetical protein BDV40DRAFT_307095 [Aspergillus tamarii]|uniref:Uncharacterized protein n=1 Tax=Aspergillus tamarii TaxID=41984 RepID=A0A5N6UAZ6_ASPTM|nr:hypothetical protein BDV40DRAFT_307095 [Aspergillus tamarii]
MAAPHLVHCILATALLCLALPRLIVSHRTFPSSALHRWMDFAVAGLMVALCTALVTLCWIAPLQTAGAQVVAGMTLLCPPVLDYLRLHFLSESLPNPPFVPRICAMVAVISALGKIVTILVGCLMLAIACVMLFLTVLAMMLDIWLLSTEVLA